MLPGKLTWRVSVDATITRAHQHATHTTARNRTQGAVSNYKNLPLAECEPAGHGIGRSRGGLSTKIHAGVDGHGRPLALVVTGGQRNDGAALETVLADIRIPVFTGTGRGSVPKRSSPTGRTRPPPTARCCTSADVEAYKGRNVAERSFALAKQWRALATRYDKLDITYCAAVVLSACITWTRI